MKQPSPFCCRKTTPAPPRSAEIHLQVGRLIDFIVTVTQDVVWKLELFIEDLDGNPLEELMFYDYYGKNTPHEPKAFRVRWAPYGTDEQGVPFECKIRTAPVGDGHFDYKPGSDPIITGTLTDATGRKEYTIEPKPFTEVEVSELLGNPFLQHASWITFTVTDPADASKTVSKTILLNHQHIAITSRNLRRLSYLGRDYDFNVLANTPWVIEKVESEDEDFKITNYPSVGTIGGNNIAGGTPINYTTSQKSNNGVKQAGRKATFYLRDLRGIIPDLVPFTISAVDEDPNCYMVSPSSGTISIPIRKLFWIREREAGDASVVDLLHNENLLQPHIIWEEYYDRTTGNPASGQVALKIEKASGGSNALDNILEVTIPPGVMGNALVGVKRQDNNTLLWSWHIWITDYNPDDSTLADYLETEKALFMHRNLGALSGEHKLNDHTVGFYYQWGRKDPLRANEIPGNKQQVSTVRNLINAINNPQVFYSNTAYGGLYDWITSSPNRVYQDDYLWTEYDNHKSQYDPCPDGWRVPNLIHGEGTGASLWNQFERQGIVEENGRLLGILVQRESDHAGSLFLPAGSRFNEYGNFTTEGERCGNYNAHAYPYANSSHYATWHFQAKGGGDSESPVTRASAAPVRCIKRK